ncbi:MAG: PEGA domain-containing protein [Methanoregula sp.]|jgi:hypothetical protein
MKQFSLLIGLAFLFFTVLAGTVSAETLNTTLTTNATTAVTTTPPERIGGSVYFETDPPGATIWLETLEVGTSALTYYSEKTGTFNVRIQKKGYEDYTGTVTVSEGKRTVFEAVLKPVTYDISETITPVITVTTVTTLRKSTITLPTPWPSSAKSPVDPAVALGAAVIGTMFFAIRRR